jgi:hypothetical protein
MTTFPKKLTASMIQLSKYWYFVESMNRDGNWYEVKWSGEQKRFYCSCMDSICRTRECKHGVELRQTLQKIKDSRNE